MTQLLSRLTIPGFGTYIDFAPGPIPTEAAYEPLDFEPLDFSTVVASEESNLLAGAVETKLIDPLVFARALPDDFDGTPPRQRLAANLSNINLSKVPAPRQLLSKAAIGELWDVEREILVEQQSGVITEVQSGPEQLRLTIEEEAVLPLQTLVPRRLVKTFYPSADFSGVNTSGDPSVIIPWGLMYKVPLPLCQRPYIHCEFQMVASINSFIYLDMVNVPDYFVQPGDVLQYDVIWLLPGSKIVLELQTATTALRDTSTVDQNGIVSHPDANLDAVALNRWYRREIPLAALAGQTVGLFMLVCDADETRGCLGYIANARIVNAVGELRLTIFNELTSLQLALVVNTPPTNGFGVVKRDYWEYGPIRKPQSGSGIVTSAMYVGNAAVDPSTYAVVETLPGLLTYRFTAQPIIPGGQPAPVSVTLSSDEFNRNPAAVKAFLFSDPVDGCGLAVDYRSFGQAAEVLQAAGIFVDGGVTSQRPAVDVATDLTFHGEVIGVNTSGAYTDTADQAGLHILNAIGMGEGDKDSTAWENVHFEDASYSVLDHIQSLTIKALQVTDFGGGESYAVTAARSSGVPGSAVTHEEPYLSAASVDRETYYRFTRGESAGLWRAEVTAKSLELLAVTVNDLVTVYCPNDPDLNGRTMLVTARTVSANGIKFSLRGYNAAAYTYVSSPVQSASIPPLVDYRYTRPLTPTSFIIVSAITQKSSDGTVKTHVVLQANAPALNVSALRFRAYLAGSAAFAEVVQPVAPGATNVQATIALDPGLLYHFEVYAENVVNAAEFQLSVPAQILSYTAIGDATPPPTGTAISVRQSGTKTVEILCSHAIPPDWGATYLNRNTVNDPNTSTTIQFGKKQTFHDQEIAYGVTYYYWFRVVDNTFLATGNPANVSGFSPGASIVIGQLTNQDYGDDSITQAKITAGAIGNAQIQANAINSAKIQANTIQTAHIQANQIDNTKLQANSIDSINIIANTIGTLKIQGNAVTTDKRQFVNTQTASYSIPAGTGQQFNFTHSIGRVPLVTADTGNSAVYSYFFSISDTQIFVVLVNRIQPPSVDQAGTLKVYFW